jgi:hypothetical protein
MLSIKLTGNFLGEPRAEADRLFGNPNRGTRFYLLNQLRGVFECFLSEREYPDVGFELSVIHITEIERFSVQPRAGNSILKVVPAPSSLSTVIAPL